MPEQLMDHYESIFQEHAKEIQRKLSDADNGKIYCFDVYAV